jgi:hypothetical protein
MQGLDAEVLALMSCSQAVRQASNVTLLVPLYQSSNWFGWGDSRLGDIRGSELIRTNSDGPTRESITDILRRPRARLAGEADDSRISTPWAVQPAVTNFPIRSFQNVRAYAPNALFSRVGSRLRADCTDHRANAADRLPGVMSQ